MSPVLVAQVAFAVPGYFAEDAPGEIVTTLPGTPRDATSQITTSPDGIDTVSGSGENPDSTAEFPGETADVSGYMTEGLDRPINHGQVMKQLQELSGGPNSGCLTSAVARSDLGKGERPDQTDDANTALAPNNADEFDCTGVEGSYNRGPPDASENPDTKQPKSKNGSDAPGKDRDKSDK